MNKFPSRVGLFEVKTRLSELLSQVQNGSMFVITKRGKPVAKLEPYVYHQSEDIQGALKTLHSIRSTITGPINIKEYVNEGRRY